MANVKWSIDDDGTNRSAFQRAAPFERKITDYMLSNELSQLITISNSHNRFLDLVFVQELSGWNERAAENFELFDRTNQHHEAYVLTCNITLMAVPTAAPTTTTKYNFEAMKEQFSVQPPETIPDNIFDLLNFTRNSLEYWLMLTADDIKRTQDELSHQRTVKVQQLGSTHPWVKVDSYRVLYSARRAAARQHRAAPSTQTKEALKRANITLMSEYNRLKNEYYNTLAAGLRRNAREFFQFFRTKRSPPNLLPTAMIHNGNNITGHTRFSALFAHLKACFPVSTNPLSNADELFTEQIDDI